MRIAVWHNLPGGGGKRQLYEHVRGLVARGHKVEAWCPSTAHSDFLPLGELCREHVLPLDWRRPRGRGRLARWTQAHRQTAAMLTALDRHAQDCARQIATRKFDVLFAGACLFFRTPFLGRHLPHLPKALYLGEPFREIHEARPRLRWAALPPGDLRHPWAETKRRLKDFIELRELRVQVREERTNAASFDSLLVNSHFSRESILRTYGVEARVCYLGVDTRKFQDRGHPRERSLLGVGSFVRAKNIEFVIRSVAELPQPRPTLNWIGDAADPAYLDSLKQLAPALGVDFRPQIRVSETKLLHWLNRASVMVYAPRLEPFGLAPLEAGACGLPVVAVAEGGVRESIASGINGILVDSDPKAFAREVEALLGDPQRLAKLRASSRQHVKTHWSIQSAVTTLEANLIHAQKRSDFTPKDLA